MAKAKIKIAGALVAQQNQYINSDFITFNLSIFILLLVLFGGAGSLYDEYGYVGAYHDLKRLGVLFAHNLSGLKARIKLMVALGAARKPEELRNWFAS